MATVVDLTKIFPSSEIRSHRLKVVAKSSGRQPSSASPIITWTPTDETYDVEFVSEKAFAIVAPRNPGWEGNLYYATSRSGSSAEWTTTIKANDTIWAAQDTTANDVLWHLYLRGAGNTVATGDEDGEWSFNFGALGPGFITIKGNIECLLDYHKVMAGEHPEIGEGAFSYMFADVPIDFDASQLILGCHQLSPKCYYKMFYGCEEITSEHLPVIPSDAIMATSCCESMFEGCSSITSAPAFTTMSTASRCYYRMFANCTALTAGPDTLPAMELSSACYRSMFYRCYQLAKAPALPAATLVTNCYKGMFERCTSLNERTIPVLSARTLADGCYDNMFTACTGIKDLRNYVLPAETLEIGSYNSMFYTSGVTYPPTISATTLAERSCMQMFYGCESLLTTPSLSAMNIAKSCYEEMFYGCTSLTSLPILPATVVPDSCYARMFDSCTGISLAVTEPATYKGTWRLPIPTEIGTAPYTDMLANTGGEFSGTPTPGTTYYLYAAESANYVTFSAPTEFTMACLEPGWLKSENDETNSGIIEYSLDGTSWTTWTGSAVKSTRSSEDRPYIIYFRGTGNQHVGWTFSIYDPACEWLIVNDAHDVSVSGNIECLLDYATVGRGEHPTMDAHGFCCLFWADPEYSTPVISSLKYAHELQLPAEILAEGTANYGVYNSMFQGCTYLVSAPVELPADIASAYCYEHMFQGCIALTAPPVVRATVAKAWSMALMFLGCTSLDYIVDLDKILTLNTGCYKSMFQGCTGITRLPPLPAMTLPGSTIAQGCYDFMFNGTGVQLSATQSGDYISAWRIPEGATVETFACNGFVATSQILEGTEFNPTTQYYVKQQAYPYTYLRLYSDDEFSMTTDITCEPGILTYSTNLANWFYWKSGDTITSANNCSAYTGKHNLFFRGSNNTIVTGINGSTVTIASKSVVYADTTGKGDGTGNNSAGSVECLLDWVSVAQGRHPEMGNYAFKNLFADCSSLMNAPKLYQSLSHVQGYTNDDYITLAPGCYSSMFARCSALSTLPPMSFPIDDWSEKSETYTIPPYACESMFEGCDMLTTAMPLVNTGTAEGHANNNTLGYQSYHRMYANCSCLSSMGEGASNTPVALTQVPGVYCYREMFAGVGGKSITGGFAAPNITVPADGEGDKVMATGACAGMYNGAVLTSAGTINANLAMDYAFESMYAGVSGVDYFPAFQVTGAGEGVFRGAFSGSAIKRAVGMAFEANSKVGGECFVNMYAKNRYIRSVSSVVPTYMNSYTYASMYADCPNIVFHETAQTGDIEFRIPASGTAEGDLKTAVEYMFGGNKTISETPKFETTYYLANPEVAETITAGEIWENTFIKTAPTPGEAGESTFYSDLATSFSNFTSDTYVVDTRNNPSAEPLAGEGYIKIGPTNEANSWAINYKIVSKDTRTVTFTFTYDSETPANTGFFKGGVKLTGNSYTLPGIGTINSSATGGQYVTKFLAVHESSNPWVGNDYVPCTAPTITYSAGTGVTMASAENGDIYYTTDGTEPTRASYYYDGPITITEATTFKAMAIAYGWGQSPVTTETITPGPAPTTGPLCFTANTAGSTVTLYADGTASTATFESSTDGTTWSEYTAGTEVALANVGDKIYFRGAGAWTVENPDNDGVTFEMTGSIAASGSVMSLIGTDSIGVYQFYEMFKNCDCLTSAPELPATTLAESCYANMLEGTAITAAPDLSHVTTLADYCFDCMFADCTALTTAPALPATTLANYCYYCMFWGCTSLTTPPALPATTLKPHCYSYMFQQCTSLIATPALPATVATVACYAFMFDSCTALTTINSIGLTDVSCGLDPDPEEEQCGSCEQMFSGCVSLASPATLNITSNYGERCFCGMYRDSSSIGASSSEVPFAEFTSPVTVFADGKDVGTNAGAVFCNKVRSGEYVNLSGNNRVANLISFPEGLQGYWMSSTTASITEEGVGAVTVSGVNAHGIRITKSGYNSHCYNISGGSDATGWETDSYINVVSAGEPAENRISMNNVENTPQFSYSESGGVYTLTPKTRWSDETFTKVANTVSISQPNEEVHAIKITGIPAGGKALLIHEEYSGSSLKSEIITADGTYDIESGSSFVRVILVTGDASSYTAAGIENSMSVQ